MGYESLSLFSRVERYSKNVFPYTFFFFFFIIINIIASLFCHREQQGPLLSTGRDLGPLNTLPPGLEPGFVVDGTFV